MNKSALKITIILILFSSLAFISNEDSLYIKDLIDEEKNDSLKLIFVGDLMCHSPQFLNSYIDSSDSYDFNPSFYFVKDIISAADLAYGNFETVIAGKEKNYSGYPLFNSPDEFLYAIKETGFNALNIANNHILDRGIFGLERTSTIIDSLGIIRLGAYISQTDRDSIRIFLKNNIKIALLSYTYGLNGNALKYNYLVNVINDSLIKNDLSKAKLQNPDLIISFLHIGEEYRRNYNKSQKLLIDNLIKYGADLIICSHPHVLQPFELVKLSDSSKLDTGFVAFSLGNFISNQDGVFNQQGAILEININKEDDKIKLINYEIHPTYCFKGSFNSKKKHIVIPVKQYSIDSLKSLGFNLTNLDIENIKKIISDTIYNVKKFNF